MRVLCKKSMYLFQLPDYSPLYDSVPKMGEQMGVLIFEKGKSYEVVACPHKDTLEWVRIYAIGEDRRAHLIFREQAYYGSTSHALAYFEFSEVGRFLKNIEV